MEIFPTILVTIFLFCNINLPISMVVFIPSHYSEEEVIKVLNNIPIDYYEELSNIIELSNKLITVILIFSIISLLLNVVKPFLIFCCLNNIIPYVVVLTIQISLIIITWCLLLSLDNNIYKMRENFFLHEIIKMDSVLVVIICCTLYLVYLIIISIILLYSLQEQEDFCKNNKYKIIYPIIFIFEYFLNIFTLCILPKDNHYQNDYFQKVYIKSCQKYGFCPNITDINEFENLQSVNKAFLSFIIIIFILTFIKFITTACAKCNYYNYRNCFLIPSIMQSIFIFINFCLIIAIASKVYKKGRKDVFYIVTYHLKRKILIILINIICYIILFILEFIVSYLDKEDENQGSNRIIPFSSHVPTSSTLNVIIPQNIPREVIPKQIEENIKDLEEKINDFIKTFIEEENKVKNNLITFLEERHSKLDKFIKNSEKEKKDIEKNKEEFEKFIKDLNKEEYDCEVDILINEINKIHYIFELSVDTIKKCKDIIIENMKGKLDKLPSFAKSKIESQIKEITDYKPIEFLDSTFGKPLKAALEKYGLSSTFIDSLKKN